ncbi:hypothetical protein RB653_005467 [Dictyostelium firmibasis]|uniref:Mitochondrial thiamine pyrophosphate carrier n=1 Tax=Dictyostelium firmibasis TaxID=79012 RepID=A0AAN7UL26_9MYCE
MIITPNSNNNYVLVELIAGSFSGALTRFIVAPLDVVKIRLQLQRTHINHSRGVTEKVNYRGIAHTMNRVIREEGIRSLWKGNLSAELLWISYAAVQFSTYNQIIGFLDPEYRRNQQKSNQNIDENNKTNYKPSPSITMIGGASAGVVSTIVSYPFDIIRTNIVNNHGKINFLQTFQSIIKRSGGYSNLFSGINSSLFQIVPQMGFQFTFYESFKFMSNKYTSSVNNNNNPLNQFTCGLLSGGLSKFLVLPFDIVKKRLQVNEKVGYGMKSCIKDLYYNEGGVKSFFKGGTPGIVKAGLAAALSFTFFEQSKRILSNKMN